MAMEFIKLDDLAINMQKVCKEYGSWRVESIGATSNGMYSLHLSTDAGEKQTVLINAFEHKKEEEKL